MRIADTILHQLGGNRFLAMTGANHLLSDGATLRMNLPRNASKANRLWVTLDATDTYTVRFFRYSAPRYYSRTHKWSAEKIVEIAEFSDVYADQLQTIFTKVTGMFTHF